MLKSIIFDLDGTLCDTMGDLLCAMNAMLRSFGWPERTRDDLLRFINRGARLFVAQSMPDGSWSSIDDKIVTDALEKYNECYAECCGMYSRPYDGIPEALAALSEKYTLGVLSNKQHPFVRRIIGSTFPGVFAAVYGNEPGVPTKPDARATDRLLRDFGADASECAFVGDSDIDMQTACNAGMLPVGVLWGYRGRDVLAKAGAKVLCADPHDLVTKL